MVQSVRTRADACPGAVTTHPAADGPLARIRVPGGALGFDQLTILARCAGELADGNLHLTSRANVQLRAVSDATELAARLHRCGLLPSAAHERVRNVLASPLSGISGGRLDVRPLVAGLDDAICADPRLAELPGRFQFGLDDGRGDLPVGALDVGWRPAGPPADGGGAPAAADTDAGALIMAGTDSGLRVPANHAVPAMIFAALAFLDARDRAGSHAWRMHELDDAGTRATTAIAETVANQLPGDAHRATVPAPLDQSGAPPVGAHRHDGAARFAVVAGVTFGTLTTGQLELLAAVAHHGVVFTPWRSVVIPGLTGAQVTQVVDQLTTHGFGTDPAAASPGVSACIGSPGCASSAADVRADTLRVLPDLPPDTATHVSGCTRRCGRPHTEHVDVVATDQGYVVDGGAAVAPDQLAATIARRRTA